MHIPPFGRLACLFDSRRKAFRLEKAGVSQRFQVDVTVPSQSCDEKRIRATSPGPGHCQAGSGLRPQAACWEEQLQVEAPGPEAVLQSSIKVRSVTVYLLALYYLGCHNHATTTSGIRESS